MIGVGEARYPCRRVMTRVLSDTTVGVIASGADEQDGPARPVGRLLAELGVNLLTGGGRGVMRSVSRAFTQAPRSRGICIGIIPCASERERGRPTKPVIAYAPDPAAAPRPPGLVPRAATLDDVRVFLAPHLG